ncbi:MAG: mechanosensitive ion channel [Crocosphaera sp.]|nr:mechanosensitive ion channel [Crocosphaera sp.]
MRTLDNYLVIIPNAKLIEDNIINYYAKPQRRIDLVIGISYGDDIDKARRLITEVLEEESRVLSDPPAVIWVGELGDNSVNLYVYPWVNSPDYLPVKYTLTETIKKKFDLEGITIPFPQRDVYLHQ